MTELMRKRVQDTRARAAVRAWEYRQRDHAKGMWFRLRRELALSRTAYVLSGDVADALERGGAEMAAVGREMEPVRRIFRVCEGDLAEHRDAIAQVPVRLGGALLEATAWGLVPFDPCQMEAGARAAHGPRGRPGKVWFSA